MKATIISLGIAGAFIVGAVMLGGSSAGAPEAPADNVRIEGERQVVDILAKGGYSPRKSVAKAGIPTVLRVETKGTYDCSIALSVPAAGFRDYLDPVGVEEIELPPQEPGAVVEGVCSMGMYNFAVVFE